MIDLPKTWLATNLGSAIDYGKTVKAEPEEIMSDTWVLELEDIEKDSTKVLQRLTFAERQSKSTKNRFDAGDILYGKLRPYLNKVVYADQSGVCTTEIVPIKPNDTVDGRYLFHWLRHPQFLAYVTEVSHGVNMPRLGTDSGRQAPFVLAPRQEQKRIADKLDTVLSRVDALNARLARVAPLLKRFRQSVLTAATSGRLIATSLDVNTEFQTVFLSQLVNEPLRNGKSVPDGTGSPVLRLTALHGHEVNFSESKLGLWEDIDPSRFFVKEGDFLVSRGNGSKNLVGQGALVGELPFDAAFPDTIIRIRPNSQICLPKFLQLTWESKMVRYQIESKAKTTAGIWKISQSDLGGIKIPLPSVEEQSEIIRRVETLFAFADRLEARLQAARTAAERLTPALLAKAFRGELVPQDPADEPAAELLKRLAASAPASPKRRGRPARTA